MPDAESEFCKVAYPPELQEREQQAIDARREHVETACDAAGQEPPQFPQGKTIGIGLSGGGIRSATFCLGVFQSLAKKRLLSHFDFMSTVSGGGYFGGFFGRLFTRRAADSVSVERILQDPRSGPVDWLRENGRYLAPNGSGDMLTGTAVLLRGWASTIVVLGLFFLTIFLWLDLVSDAGWALLHYWQSRSRAGAFLATQLGNVRHYLNPRFWLAAIALLGAVVPLSWAYWLRGYRDARGAARFVGAPIIVAVVVAIASFLLWRWLPRESPAWGGTFRDTVWLLIAVTAAMSLVWYGLGKLRLWSLAWAPEGAWNSPTELDRDELLTNRLADWLGWSIAVLCGLLAFAAIDYFGVALSNGWLWVAGGAAVVGNVVVPLAQKITAIFGARLGAKPGQVLRLGAVSTLLLNVLGLGLAFVLLVLVNAVAHRIVEPWAPRSGWASIICSLAVSVAILLFSCISGHTLGFLNRSTPSGIYAARLTRTYLGASNELRLNDPANADVTNVVPGDGVALGHYSPHEHGGPLHIINTTINETIDGKSQIEQQDRKGLILAVGPFGVSVGVKHHANWLNRVRRALIPLPMEPDLQANDPRPEPNQFSVFDQGRGVPVEPEPLDLGRWLAISGAAFSTGVGSSTCLGLSLLAGLFNVRLGYYWDSGVNPSRRAQKGTTGPVKTIRQWLTWLFPAQMGLVDEFTARFHGTAEQLWNLSDGGCFENLAGYELIRRRVPFIVICDAGEDADYSFENLGNLVRKARTDFGAEIRFLTEEEIAEKLPARLKKVFGSLANLRRVGAEHRPTQAHAGEAPLEKLSVKHAALAWVKYADSTRGMLIYIKPTLTGDESADVIEYADAHPDFPHEPTANQFFDEAQWESYRRLGEHIAKKVFSKWKWKMIDMP
jgi:hypothetical protein